MTTYQTGNPIGSADPRDLYDNAQVIDDYANSEQPTTTDRLGVERATIAGIDAAARNAIANAGYEFVGDYAPGIELTAYNQVVRDTSGEFWRVSGSTALPYTTTGAGLPEGGAFVTVGDAALRQELAAGVSTGQGGMLVSGAVIYVDTIADLQALDTSALVDGQQVQVKEYHAGTGVGGGVFFYDPDRSRSDHDGGSVIDSSKEFPQNWSSEQTAWFSADGQGSGCYVRTLGSEMPVEHYGAFGDGFEDDYMSIQTAIDGISSHGLPVVCRPATYRITQSIELYKTTNTVKTIVFKGSFFSNTTLLLDNDSEEACISYDSGYKQIQVGGVSCTDGSPVVTSSGGFISEDIAVGDFVVAENCKGLIDSIDSDTQITLDRNATETKSGFLLRVNHRGVLGNRISISDFELNHTAPRASKRQFHQGYGVKLMCAAYSFISRVRAVGFTKGLYSHYGWINEIDNFVANGCRRGIHLNTATYRWTLTNCTTAYCGVLGVSDLEGGWLIEHSGSINLINPITEVDTTGWSFEGVSSMHISGCSLENSINSYCVISSAYRVNSNDEDLWSKGIVFDAPRLYNFFGMLFREGVDDITINSPTITKSSTFNPAGKSYWFRPLGEFNKIRNIKITGGTYPEGLEYDGHLNQANANMFGSAQSITVDGKSYDKGTSGSSGNPYYGKYWKKGDVVYIWKDNVTDTSPVSWVCTADADGVSDNTATWRKVGVP
jgi:hypothetical protein